MSAFVVNNRTRTIIAKYLAAFANYKVGLGIGVYKMRLSDSFKEYLQGAGCYDGSTGLYLAAPIHALLTKHNVAAVESRYGKGEASVDDNEPMAARLPIDTSDKNCRQWLANLYVVTRCYVYQISEGDYKASPLWVELNNLLGQMAECLAAFAVADIRPKLSEEGWKPWDVF